MAAIKRNCIICGSEFETTRSKQGRCPACANLKRATCVVCGKEFVAERRNYVKTCSGACARALQLSTLQSPGHVRKCAVCGNEFAPSSPSAKKCTECQRKTLKPCAVCGKLFAVHQSSSSRVHACPACRPRYTAAKQFGKRPNVWSGAANERSDKDAMRDRAKAVRPAAVEAARRDPKSGPYVTNINAKVWTLETPSGDQIEVRNLALFVREHPEWFPDEKVARARIGYCAKAERLGLPKRTWNGWSVIGQPVVPEDAKIVWDAAREKREKQDAARKQRQKENKPPSE